MHNELRKGIEQFISNIDTKYIDQSSIKKTPNRYCNALQYLTSGYHTHLDDIVNNAIYETNSNSIIIIKDIDLFSLCEHHLLPFFGKAHIAYIPNKHIIGLSKIPRILDMYAKRLQVQERLIDQSISALEKCLKPKGIIIVLEMKHLCVAMRGIEQTQSKTTTIQFRGIFKDNFNLRKEILSSFNITE